MQVNFKQPTTEDLMDAKSRNELLTIAAEMRERQVAKRFKSPTLVDWASRIERAIAPPTPSKSNVRDDKN